MRLEIVNSQVSFVGKMKEQAKIEQALTDMAEHIGCSLTGWFDNSEEDCDYCDISFAYSQEEWTVADIKYIWRELVKG